jgi:hypothetical protein
MQVSRSLSITTFLEMKEIAGELGEMNIPLKPGTLSLVRKRPYRLNPK